MTYSLWPLSPFCFIALPYLPDGSLLLTASHITRLEPFLTCNLSVSPLFLPSLFSLLLVRSLPIITMEMTMTILQLNLTLCSRQ